MITASHLSKRYKSTLAVNDLSFTVETGKVTGFLGPNGAGKSTTMRLMLGLDLGSGTTNFDGKQLHDYKQPAQVVGILLDAKAFHPTRSAEQHLKVLADAGGIDQARVSAVLAEVGLSSVAKKAPGKFSLGMAQRLGIAAALLGQPKYLVLDEPANGLDPEGIAWLRDFLRAYAAKGNAVFVSSHLLGEMSHLADNVVVIGRGKILADTSMTDFLDQHAGASVFVRSSEATQLQAALKAAKLHFKPEQGGFVVASKTTDAVGKALATKHVPILELSMHRASLEDVFLQVTAGSEEYIGTRQQS